MSLRDYIYFERITHKQFAEKVGISPGRLSCYINYRIPMAYRTAKRIADATDGKLDVWEILKDNLENCEKLKEQKEAEKSSPQLSEEPPVE